MKSLADKQVPFSHAVRPQLVPFTLEATSGSKHAPPLPNGLCPLVQSSTVYREIYDHGLLERQFADAVEARGAIEDVA